MKRASLSVSLAAMLGAMGSMLSTGVRVGNDYSTRPVKVGGYKGIGGRPFTRGKRSKSLKVRSNRSKAKAKARGKK